MNKLFLFIWEEVIWQKQVTILNILELNLISLKEMYDYEHGNILSLKAHLKTNGDNISVYTPNLLPNLLLLVLIMIILFSIDISTVS